MKTVLLTSNHKRHQYIAQCLYEKTDLRLIITEEKSSAISDTSKLNKDERVFLENHFYARQETENKYYGNLKFPANVPRLKFQHGKINSKSSQEILKEIKPDIIVLFGSSIIQDFILETFPNKFINLHLGLSPYFKGSATNLFPLLYKKPQCIGATIHLATKEVDAGGILHQLRPLISENDNLHDVGNKVILKAGKELPDILQKYHSGLLVPKEQKTGGEICKLIDMKPSVLKEIYRNVENGLFQEYLKNKSNMDSEYPIIEQEVTI